MGDARIGSSIPSNIPTTDTNSVDASQSEISTPQEPAANTEAAINKAAIETHDYMDVDPLKSDLDPAAELQKMLQEVDPNQTELRTPGQMTQQLMEQGRMQQLAGPSFAAKPAATVPLSDPTGLKKGESISANVTQDQEGMHFEFERPVTKEQAAALIFQNGKIPPGAQLIQGKGNTWTVKIPFDVDAINNTVRHFNSHTETVYTPRNPITGEVGKSIQINTWVGGAPKTHSGGPRREDLFNDMGFMITKHYQLDEGQRKTDTLGQKGHGYEVAFQKPMTKDEVMKKLFDEHKITQGEARLVPMTPEPTTLWRVEVIGTDATSAFNRKAFRAFGDASVYTKASLPSGTPAGIRSHIENHTIPKEAKHFKPDVYVWEQDGYMMYVKTNNKGKDGYYEPQFTKMPDHEEGKIWMRYYMVEQGMQPRDAWQKFWEDTVEVTAKQLSMINSAYGGGLPRIKGGTPKNSFGEEGPSAGGPRSVRGRSASGHVDSDVPSGSSKGGQKPSTGNVPAEPPPAGGPSKSGRGQTIDDSIAPKGTKGLKERGPFGLEMKEYVRPDGRVIRTPAWRGDDLDFTIKTPNGTQKIKGIEYRLRLHEAQEWVTDQYHRSNKITGAGPPPELYKEAAKKFGLDEGWFRGSNPIMDRIDRGI